VLKTTAAGPFGPVPGLREPLAEFFLPVFSKHHKHRAVVCIKSLFNKKEAAGSQLFGTTAAAPALRAN